MAQAPQLRADNIDEIIAAMTLEEKAQLLTGCGNAGFPGSGAAMGHQTKLVAGAAGVTAGAASFVGTRSAISRSLTISVVIVSM